MSPHKHRLLECLCAKVETRPPFHIHLPEQNIGAPPRAVHDSVEAGSPAPAVGLRRVGNHCDQGRD